MISHTSGSVPLRPTNTRIEQIGWSVYRKIRHITKGAGSAIAYQYDAAGNRVSKTLKNGQTEISRTRYVRDAQGNTLAEYTDANGSNDWKLEELTLYRSNRLGMYKSQISASSIGLFTGIGSDHYKIGSRVYELSNHLGNVLTTISDKKIGLSSNGTTVTAYEAEVLSQQEYYPFGMLMPDEGHQKRQYSLGSYRYGFNGKENDNEVKGEGNQQDYGMRIYDPRLARFLSVDPLGKNYAMLTPYQYASNRPIDGVDLDGLEYLTFHVQVARAADGKPTFSIFYKEDFRGLSAEAMASIHNQPDYAKEFYELYSESFGPEGRGFKWVYFDEKGNQLGEPVWQMKQSKSLYFNGGNSGYYSGAGSIIKFGPGLKDGRFNELNSDYDFSYAPMGYADAISRRHDMIQEKDIAQPQGWLEDARTLRSDRILLSDAKRGLLLDETNSREDFIRTTNITIFFSAVIRYKERKETRMQNLGLDINSVQDQLKVIFNDWKPGLFSSDWYARQLLSLSGGGAKENERNTIKLVGRKTP